jgi:hypothetical protein
MRSRVGVRTGNAGSLPRGARWAVVSFSEKKRTFDTGNIVKWVGNVQRAEESLSRGGRSSGVKGAEGTGLVK